MSATVSSGSSTLTTIQIPLGVVKLPPGVSPSWLLGGVLTESRSIASKLKARRDNLFRRAEALASGCAIGKAWCVFDRPLPIVSGSTLSR